MSHRCFLKRTFALLVKAWALLFSWANNRETRKWHSILISNPRPVFFFFWGGGSFRVWSHVQLNVKSELWMSRNVDSTKDIRRKQRFLGFFFSWECAASASETGKKDTAVSRLHLYKNLPHHTVLWRLLIFLTFVCFKWNIIKTAPSS